MLVSDIALSEFRAIGADLLVSYEIAHETAPAFNVSIYRSSDGNTPDTIVASRAITLESRLRPGAHNIEIVPDFIDFKGDYRLIAVVDSLNQVAETSEDNNQLVFAGGVFRTRGGVVHLHGADEADMVTIKAGQTAGLSGRASITITTGDWSMDYHGQSRSVVSNGYSSPT